MAKNMAGKESDPIKIFANFFTKLAEKAGKAAARRSTTKEGERSKFIERAAKLRTEQTPEELQNAKESAKQITQKLRSGNRLEVEEAEKILKESEQLAGTIDESLRLKREALMLAAIRGDAPEWLIPKISEIQHSGAAAELVANVAYLSKDLRDDPYVLYEVVRRTDLVFDVKSSTSEAISEYVHVRRAIVERIRERMQEFSRGGEDTTLLEGFYDDGIFGEKFDLYRSKKIRETPQSDSKPKKPGRGASQREYDDYRSQMEDWVKRNTAFLQWRDLDSDLRVAQTNFDLGDFVGIKGELGLLDELEKKLRNGKYERDYDQGDIHYRNRKSSYNPQDADEYLKRVFERKKVLTALQDHEQLLRGVDESRRRAEAQGYHVVTFDMIKDRVPRGDWPKNWQHKQDFVFHHFQDEHDLRLLLSGPEGEAEIFDQLITESYGYGKEPGRPSLPQEYKWDELFRYLRWKYEKIPFVRTQIYEYIWKDSARVNQIVKNLLFTPGDPRDKIKNLQFFTGADMDHFLKNYEHSNFAWSFYEEVLFDTLSERAVEYRAALEEMMGNHHAKMDRFFELRELESRGQITAVQAQELAGLGKKVDTIGWGVMLWDTDVQNYTEVDLELGSMEQQLGLLQHKQELGGELRDWEEALLRDLPDSIRRKSIVRDELRQFQDVDSLRQDLTDNRGLSRVDVEVKVRLREYLKKHYGDNVPEWKLNRAVWAARQAMIGSSRMLDIGSQYAIRPAYEFWGLMQEKGRLLDIGKYVMKSPAFEDLQRIVNPDLFMYRFGMSGEAGTIARAMLNIGQLEKKGFKFKDDPKYRREDEKHMDLTVRQAREFMRQVQDETGLSQTELILNGFFESGGLFDKSIWRIQMAGLDPIRDKYLDQIDQGQLSRDANINLQGLGIRFSQTPKSEDGGIEGKKQYFLAMIHRNPSKLFHYLGEPLDEIMRTHNVTPVERMRLRRAFSVSLVSLWDKKEYATRNVNLTSNEDNFMEILYPILREQGFSEERAVEMFRVLQKADGAFTAESDERISRGGYQFKSRLEAVATMEQAITPMLSDMDMKEATLFTNGTIGNDRRGRDMWGMARARDALLMLDKPELLMAKDPKETIKKLYEFREAMGEYTTPDAAEKAAYELIRKWFKFGRNRLNYSPLWWWTRWVPLLQPAMKLAGEVDMRNWKDSKIKVFGHLIKYVPREIATQVSYSARYKGLQANVMKEKEFDHIIDELTALGMFTTNEQFYHELRHEFHATLGWQIYGVVADNWWLAPILASAMGLKQGAEEEERSGRSGH